MSVELKKITKFENSLRSCLKLYRAVESSLRADAAPDIRNYRVDCSKIKSTLTEYQPQWNVRKGAQQLYEAYLKVGLKQEEFEGPRYRRIHHIKYLIKTGRLDESLRWRENVAASGA